MTASLREALGVDGGIVCAVGAGGKKTTLYRLADGWPGRLAISATVFSAPPARRVYDERIVESGERLFQRVMACTARRLAYAEPSEKPGRVGGVAPELLTRIHAAAEFPLTLVKADGARMRGVKAPRTEEPVIPPNTRVVLHISSAAVLGEPLSEATAHRLTELEAVTGAAAGQRFTPHHLARLLVSPAGARARLGEARLVPIINQVDDAARRRLAQAAAEEALDTDPALERVVLTSLRAEQPVVAIVQR